MAQLLLSFGIAFIVSIIIVTHIDKTNPEDWDNEEFP